MFVNIFPKTLSGLLHQAYPRHRLQPVLLPLVSPAEYIRLCQTAPERAHPINTDELEKAMSFRIDKRRDEWLTGRLCAKLAAMRYCNSHSNDENDIQLQHLVIDNTESGRPRLTGNLPPELLQADVSISHGAGYGLALVADSLCGADIQQQTDTLHKVREKFCTIEEQGIFLDTLPELTEIQHLSLLWSAKEAAKKTLSHQRMPGFMELILTVTEPHTNGWIFTFLISSREFDHYPRTITVAAELYQEYAIALCLNPEHPNA